MEKKEGRKKKREERKKGVGGEGGKLQKRSCRGLDPTLSPGVRFADLLSGAMSFQASSVRRGG